MSRSATRASTRAQIAHQSRKAGKNGRLWSQYPRACGKNCYKTRSEAKSAIRRYLGTGLLKDVERMEVYWCEECDAWHIGHGRRRQGEAQP